MKTLVIILGLALAGCTSSYSIKKHEFQKSPCACTEIPFKEAVKDA